MSHPPLRFVCIGTGNSEPQADRGPTSTLIRYREQRIVVDLGSGALQKLAAADAHPSEVDAICLTHLHIDHISDLQALLFGISVETIPRQKPLDIYASSETLAYVLAMKTSLGKWLSRRDDLLRWHEVTTNDAFVIGDVQVMTSTVNHSSSSVALKFITPEAQTLAIPGDTGPHAPLEDFLRGVDAAVIECGSDPSDPVPTHLSPEELRALLVAANPKRAFVVHRPVRMQSYPLEAFLQEQYTGQVIVPNDLDAFDL